MSSKLVTCAVAAVCSILTAVLVSRAGPLDPPAGPVAPSYKTLSEVEPRIAINSSNTPGDADCVHKITKSGSYYLVADLTAPSGKSGIEVDLNTAGDVTIDLNGFTLRGAAGSNIGIISSGFGHIEISNGSVTGFGFDGMQLDCRDGRVERVTFTNCLRGVTIGGQGSVSDCYFREIDHDALFLLSVGSVERCIAWDCGTGIAVPDMSVVAECQVVGSPRAANARAGSRSSSSTTPANRRRRSQRRSA